MKGIVRLATFMLFAGYLPLQAIAQQPTDKNISQWAYDSLHIPQIETSSNNKINKVIVAVVDDAFRLSHSSLKGFGYKNPFEIPGNQLDDDGNNYVDDVYGWDVSDNDSDVGVPEGREQLFYHGTYIASIITNVATRYFGKAANQYIQIMPVKVLSDHAPTTYLKDGYKGIKYAIDNGANIICLAWSGGRPGAEELNILREAQQKGILIIASTGNFNEKEIPYPALAPEVLAVAGVNKEFEKEKHSNFGMFTDISAPAEDIRGAHPAADNAFILESGTSPAAALVTACAAILLSKNEGLTPLDIKEALLNTAAPFNENFSDFGGKMGAGIVNLEKALDYVSNASKRSQHYSSLRSKGSILIDANSNSEILEINPAGGYEGFYLEPQIGKVKKPTRNSFSILVNDTLWNSYYLSNMPVRIFVPYASLKIKMQSNSFKKNDLFRINFYGKPIDSTTLYCSGIRYLNHEQGSVDDGSAENNYANHCSCKWMITVPVGKRIKFTFDKMDTQGNIDFVYLVDGQTVLPENIIAKFSGQNKPPIVFSRSNEVLVWFVTDGDTTGQGWQFHYEAVE